MMVRGFLGASAFAFAVIGNMLGSWGALTWAAVLSVAVGVTTLRDALSARTEVAA